MQARFSLPVMTVAVMTGVAYLPSAYAAEQVVDRFTVGPWAGAVYADADGGYRRCDVWATYGGRLRLAFSASAEGFAVGVSDTAWRLRPGEGYDLRIIVDGHLDAQYRATAVNTQTMVVRPDNATQVIKAFRYGEGARLFAGTDSYFPGLNGSGQAIDAVLACNIERRQAKAPAATAETDPPVRADEPVTTTRSAGDTGSDRGREALAWRADLERQSPLSRHLMAMQSRALNVMERIDQVVSLTVARAEGRISPAEALTARTQVQDALQQQTVALEALAGELPDLDALPGGGTAVAEAYRSYLSELGDRLLDLATYADQLFDSPPEDKQVLSARVLAYQVHRQGAPVSLELRLFEQELLAVARQSPEYHLKRSRIETSQAFLDLLKIFVDTDQTKAGMQAAIHLRAAVHGVSQAREMINRGRQALIAALREAGAGSIATDSDAEVARLLSQVSSTYAESFDVESEISEMVMSIVGQLQAPAGEGEDGRIPIDLIRPLMIRQWDLQRERLQLAEEMRGID